MNYDVSKVEMIANKKQKYHVYVDYTTSEPINPFYVGKGTHFRLIDNHRNDKHSWVERNNGCARIVVYETFDEFSAFEIEKQFIKELHTYIRDPLCNEIAANFTEGGDGVSGLVHSENTKNKIKEKRKKQTEERNIRHSPVAQYSLNGKLVKVYFSISDAVKETGIKNIVWCEMITNRGKRRKTAGGFMWRRFDHVNDAPQNIEPYEGPKKTSVSVLQYDLNGNFMARHESMTAATLQTNVKKFHIALQCEGQKPFKNDQFIWKYEFPERDSKSARANRKKITCFSKVSQYKKDGTLVAHYKNINEAQKKLRIVDLHLVVRGIKIDVEYDWIVDDVHNTL